MLMELIGIVFFDSSNHRGCDREIGDFIFEIYVIEMSIPPPEYGI